MDEALPDGLESEWVVHRPTGRLAEVVERYIGYRMLGFAPGIHRGLPSPRMTFIVSIGPEIDVVAQSDATQAPVRYRGVVGGLQTTPALIAHDGNQEGVEIELTPLGCRALWGLPARALWNTSVELGDLVGPIGNELWERLQPAASWRDRFAVCDEVLGALLGDDDPGRTEVVPELQYSWQRLVGSGGAAPVSDLAQEVGWSRQHLARRFKHEFGLAPKLAARVVRFERARRMLQATPSFVSIAQVAATCGYYDQAHLNRDFVDLAGCPPGRLLADESIPSFQDPELAAPSS